MVHSCNPSYSGGRDQKDCGSKLVGVETIPQKYSTQNRVGRVVQVVERHLASMRP
jgi:hypothetical protein